MKTLVEMHQEMCNTLGKYFPGEVQRDRWFRKYDRYQRVVLWSTYPELDRQAIEVIEELLLQNATAEEILAIMNLEDRDKELKEHMEQISSLREEEWYTYLKEEIIASICNNYWGLSRNVEEKIKGKGKYYREDTYQVMLAAIEKLDNMRGDGEMVKW